jgi:hypothetical protein
MADSHERAVDAAAEKASTGRRVVIGCFTAILGCLSGGMVAVLVAKFVAFVTRAQSCPGIPTCDWYVYWAVGALVGGTTLPLLVVWALGRPKQTNPN